MNAKFTEKRQNVAVEILERYRNLLYQEGQFKQSELERELKACWHTGYQEIKTYAHEMYRSPRYRYVAIHLMEYSYPNLINSDHSETLRDAYGCFRASHPGSEDVRPMKDRFWKFFREVIVPLDKEKRKLDWEPIFEKYRKQLYTKPHEFYAIGMREELFAWLGQDGKKIKPREVDTLMLRHVRDKKNVLYYHLALYYLCHASGNAYAPVGKVIGEGYFDDREKVDSYWKKFGEDIDAGISPKIGKR